MGFNSINTNVGAMLALQALASINSELAVVQQRISTGLKVGSARDDPATWAIAQNERSDIMALDAVKDSLNRGQSTVDVAISAGETISDLLNQMKAKALAATEPSLDTNARAALANDFVSLRDQIQKTVAAASFNGVNLLSAGAGPLMLLASADGRSKLTVQAQVMALGPGAPGSIITFTAGASFSSAGSASAMLAQLSASITNVNAAVARLGTGEKALQTHFSFIDKLQDSLTVAVGNLVDADVARESARLQALQVRQQLAIKALSIASQSTSLLLRLFQTN